MSKGPSYTAVQTYAKIQIDGDLEEWKGVEPIVMDDKSYGVDQWSGPEDLSARAYLVWDADYLYFACDVTDDVLYVPPNVIWSGDAIQMTFDPLNDDMKGGQGPDDHDLAIGLSQKGSGIARYRVPQRKGLGMMEAIDVAVQKKPDGRGYFYEMAVPWEELYPLSPVAQVVCGFSFAVSDNDGEGFKGGLAWTAGIWYGKDASALADLILRPVPPQEGGQVFVSVGPRWSDDEEDVEAYVGINSAHSGQAAIDARVEIGEEGVVDLSRKVQLEPGVNRFRVVWNTGRAPIGRYHFVVYCGEARSSAEVLKYSSLSLEPEIAAIDEALKGVRGEEEDIAGVKVRLDKARKALRQETLALLSKIYGFLDEARGIIGDLAEGRHPLEGQTGDIRRAFLSTVDSTYRSYRIFLPDTYDGSRPFPLIVWLHGQGGNEDSAIDSPPVWDLLVSRAAQRGFIIAFPDGRGGDYRLAEEDVLTVIAEMERIYRIDEDRIYLSGMSLGGGGTWVIGLQHPDLFAAIAPFAGLAQAPELMGNALHIAPYVVCGDADFLVNENRAMVARLKGLAYEHRYAELPGLGHNPSIFDEWPNVLDWFQDHVRVKDPKTVVFSAHDPEHGEAYWVRIEKPIDPGSLATVEAEIKEGNLVEVKSKNIARMCLLFDRSPLNLDRSIEVRVGGQKVYRKKIPSDQEVVLEARMDRSGKVRDWSAKLRP